MREGHKPGDVEVPLLPDVPQWHVPSQGDIERGHWLFKQHMDATARAHQMVNKTYPVVTDRRSWMAPEPRPGWRQRWIDWWCSHQSAFARGDCMPGVKS